MSNIELLTAFFDAENSRDWDTYRRFLHKDVTWFLHSRETITISGIDAYMNTIMAAYKDNQNVFTCEKMYKSTEEDRIVAILVNNLGVYSCDIFDFRDGLVFEEHEFIIN